MITAGSIPKWIREIQTKKQQQEQAAKETASSLQGMKIDPTPPLTVSVPSGEEQQVVRSVRSKPRRKVVIEESGSSESEEEEVIVRKKNSSKSKPKTSKVKIKKKQESSSEDEDLMEEDVEEPSKKYKNLSKYLRK